MRYQLITLAASAPGVYQEIDNVVLVGCLVLLIDELCVIDPASFVYCANRLLAVPGN